MFTRGVLRAPWAHGRLQPPLRAHPPASAHAALRLPRRTDPSGCSPVLHVDLRIHRESPQLPPPAAPPTPMSEDRAPARPPWAPPWTASWPQGRPVLTTQPPGDRGSHLLGPRRPPCLRKGAPGCPTGRSGRRRPVLCWCWGAGARWPEADAPPGEPRARPLGVSRPAFLSHARQASSQQAALGSLRALPERSRHRPHRPQWAGRPGRPCRPRTGSPLPTSPVPRPGAQGWHQEPPPSLAHVLGVRKSSQRSARGCRVSG